MSYYTEKQIIYINSRNRNSGTNSNFTITLDNIDTTKKFDKITVLDISIPKSYYIVSSNNNSFTVLENGISRTITIPSSNYNRISLKNILLSLLNTGTYVYSISYSNISQLGDDGKFIFSVSNNTDQPSFIFTNQLYEVMGFDINSTNVFVGDSLASTNVMNLNPESTLFLRSDICQNSNEAILQNIITTQDSTFAYITWNNPNPQEYSKDFLANNKNVFHFVLTDENENIIDTNGLNIVLTIMLYRTNKIDYLIKEYINYKTIIDAEQQQN